MPVKVAILGSGIFATEFYLPALSSCPSLELHSLWSRSLKSVSSLETKALTLPHLAPLSLQVEHGDAGLEKILSDSSMQAVIIVLPLTVQPDFVRKALKAGKHVISEKPLAKDVETAKELIEEYEREYKTQGLIWRVAENYAHEPGVLNAAELVRDPSFGPVLYWQARFEDPVQEGAGWHATAWRNVPTYQGGFCLDGGVHMCRLLQVVLPTPPARIVSSASLHRNFLLPTDTITALALPPLNSGGAPHGGPTLENSSIPVSNSSVTGTVLLSYATPNVDESKRPPNGLWVVGTKGTLQLTKVGDDRGGWSVARSYEVGSGNEDCYEYFPNQGVPIELEAWGKALEKKIKGDTDEVVSLAEPRMALWDVALIQAALTSDGKEVTLEDLLR